jgi:mRNA-degrading endonuclease RelE of RelBE toxin-antitoxin system
MVEQRKKDLWKLSKAGKNNLELIVDKILKFDFNSLDIKKLSNTNLYRCRSGKYRIIFLILWWNISIIKIGKRWDVYKGI